MYTIPANNSITLADNAAKELRLKRTLKRRKEKEQLEKLFKLLNKNIDKK